MTQKGDHIPKEDRGEGTRWKAPLSTRPEKRKPGWRSNTDPWEGRTAVRTSISQSLQRQPEVVEPHEDQKQTQPKEESNVTVVDWGRTPTGPEIGDLTGRAGTPPDPGVQRQSSTMRASQQVPDKEPGQQPPQRSYGGRTTKDKPQPPQASRQHRKREGRTQGKVQENSRYLDQPTARVRGPRTQGRDEPRRAADTAFAAHKRLKRRRPEAHSP